MKPQDIQDLKQLIEFLREHQVAEFDLDRGDMKIRLKFAQPAAGLSGIAQALSSVAPAAVQPSAAAPQVAPSTPAGTPTESEAGLHIMKSPMVGTFYGSPSPGGAAFVSPGDHVEKGQIVCIIEAMKLMNEIETDATGEIVKCMVTNGQPIEFGQPLFAIRTA